MHDKKLIIDVQFDYQPPPHPDDIPYYLRICTAHGRMLDCIGYNTQCKSIPYLFCTTHKIRCLISSRLLLHKHNCSRTGNTTM